MSAVGINAGVGGIARAGYRVSLGDGMGCATLKVMPSGNPGYSLLKKLYPGRKLKTKRIARLKNQAP